MLVSMKQILQDAKEKHYAVPAFDVSNYEMMRSVLEVCEEERSPAILMGLSVDLADRGMELLHGMAKAASDYFDIPVCMHFDHATDIEWIKRACDLGFSSVMFDGSVLPFEENAEKTAQVVEYAHRNGISVEAELGHVGNGAIGGLGETDTDTDPGETLTVPEEVTKFVEITDVDALAVAIGTAHGVYKKTPALRIDRLKEITAVCDRPLVLHGGSGTPAEQMQEAIRNGITKINIYHDVVAAMNRGIKSKTDNLENITTWPILLFEDARAQMKEVIRQKVRTFGSNNRL